MSASPEYYCRVSPAATFSPCASPRRTLLAGSSGEEDISSDYYYYSCRTPTGQEAAAYPVATCPPAPRKPRPAPAACRKRLFEDVQVLSLRLDDLERLFRPAPPPPPPSTTATTKKPRPAHA